MSAAPPDEPAGMSRTQIMVVTMVAEVVGAVLIVFVLPFAWGPGSCSSRCSSGWRISRRAVLRRSDGA